MQAVFLIIGLCVALDILLGATDDNMQKVRYNLILAWRHLMLFRAYRREQFMSRRYSGYYVKNLPQEDKVIVNEITKQNVDYVEKHPELSETYNSVYNLMLELGRKRLKDLEPYMK